MGVKVSFKFSIASLHSNEIPLTQTFANANCHSRFTFDVRLLLLNSFIVKFFNVYLHVFQEHPDFENLTEALAKAQEVNIYRIFSKSIEFLHLY
jgi:hypothetical protein